MMKLFLFSLMIFLAGCAIPPREELQSARMALTRAQHAGAQKLTPVPYQEALEALRRGEALIREKDYEEARKVLPIAEDRARQALNLAEEEKARLEREREKVSAIAALPTPRHPKTAPPAAPPSAPPQKPKPPSEKPPLPNRHTVEDKETLPAIAAREEVYGDELLWPLLYQANRDQIRDPRQIYPGQSLTIPRGLPSADLEEIREKALRSDIFTSSGQKSAPGFPSP